MDKKNYNALLKALRKQRKEVASSKKAGKKLLKDLGVLHLFFPKDSGNIPASPDSN